MAKYTTISRLHEICVKYDISILKMQDEKTYYSNINQKKMQVVTLASNYIDFTQNDQLTEKRILKV